MYIDYFGLTEKPFSLTPDAKYLFLTKQCETALDLLAYSVTERLGFSVLSGEVGSGKTTLTREFLNRLDDSCATALLVNPLMSQSELLQAVNRDFGNPVRNFSLQKQMEGLNRFLLRQYEQGKNAVVVIDEAQNLPDESLEVVRMLGNIETEKAKLLQIVLVGQPELMDKLNRHELRQLNQRIAVKSTLVPLTFMETLRYINHRIFLAGGTSKIFFEPKFYKVIYKASRGYPRLINLLCDRSLIAAYAGGTTAITARIAELAVADLKGSQGRRRFPFFGLKRILRCVSNS